MFLVDNVLDSTVMRGIKNNLNVPKSSAPVTPVMSDQEKNKLNVPKSSAPVTLVMSDQEVDKPKLLQAIFITFRKPINYSRNLNLQNLLVNP
ncbi:hypothetical protein TorRG33x02_135440 [Trema orientale]|uniref:Uncharacterized protein n=1 Tax=Trema orientale TaxID=63057 RepID=A0A2P5EYS6_TREOI|nr:hypothetical protein TorRG33x02_135440 [Trema orientale]